MYMCICWIISRPLNFRMNQMKATSRMSYSTLALAICSNAKATLFSF